MNTLINIISSRATGRAHRLCAKTCRVVSTVIVLAFLIAMPSAVQAATATLKANDASNTSSFTSSAAGTNWLYVGTPDTFTNYFTSTFYLRTPPSASASTYTFGGSSLTLQAYASANARSMIFKGANGDVLNINNFTNAAGALINEGSGTAGYSIGGNLWTIAGNSGLATDQGGPITVNSPLAGSATFTNSGTSTITYNGTNSAFTGTLVVASGTVAFNSLSNILGNPASLTPGQYTLGASATLKDNVGVTLNAPNSGVTLTGAATINTATAGLNTLIGIPITGAFGLTKTGSGILTLTGVNTFTGGLTLNGGQINLNNASALGTGTLNINNASAIIDNTSGGAISNANNNAITISTSFTNNGSYDLNLGTGSVNNGSLAKTITVTAGTLTFGGAFTGSGSLTKAGNGTLSLGGPISSPNFTINGGKLALTGSATLSATNLTVGTNATLDVSGLSASTLALNTGQTLFGSGAANGTIDCSVGTIAPGGSATAGTLTVTDLTLSSSGFLTYDLANVTTTGGGTNDYIVVTGTLTLGGFTTLTLNYLNAIPAASGKYTLISYGTYSGPVGDISSYFSIPSGFTITNNTVTKTIDLLPIHTPASVLWIGNNGNSWDTITPNWNSVDNLFYNGDSPRFDDSAVTTSYIYIPSAVNCGTLTVSNSVGYDFTGSAITAGSLTKQSSGTLTLENDVTISAGTLVAGGTLQVGNGGSTGTLTSSGVTNNSALVFNRDTTTGLTIAAPISGSGSVAQIGTGSTALTASNSYTGLTTVSAGSIIVANGAALGTTDAGTVVSSGGQVYITQNVNVGNESLSLAGDGPVTDGALRKGGGGITYYGGAVTLTDNSRIKLDGNATLLLTNAAGITAASSFNLILTGDGGSAGTVSGSIALGTGGGLLSKTGASTWTLGGANSVSLDTISGGTLILANQNALGTNLNVVLSSTTGGAGLTGTRLTLSGGLSIPSNRTLTMPSSGAGTIRSALFGTGAGITNTWAGSLLLTGDSGGGNIVGIGVDTSSTLIISGNITGDVTFPSSRLIVRGASTGVGYLLGTVSLDASSQIQVADGSTWILGSAANTWLTTYFSDNSTLRLGINNALPTGTILSVINSTANRLDLAGFNQTIGGFGADAATGLLITNTSSSADSSLTYSGASTTFGGRISDGTKKLNLTLDASSTLVLTNTSTLNIAHSTVTVPAGSILDLNYTGTNTVNSLVLGGVSQPAGYYSSANASPYLADAGVLFVNPGPSGPASITNTVTDSTLNLAWPAGQGWRLQMQTNSLSTGLSTNWTYLTDGSISSTNLTVDPTKPTVFYRLTYP